MLATRPLFDPADLAACNSQQPPAAPAAFTPPAGALSVTPGATPGCYAVELSNDAYHAERSYISHTGMIHLLRSPAHYEAYLTKSASNTPNPYSAFHSAVLEPARFASEYVLYPARRQGKAWEAFQEQHPNVTILNTTEMEQALGMRGGVQAYDEIPLWALLQASEVEKSIFWFDQELGVNMRIRVDALHPTVILDMKGIDDARPDKIIRQVVQKDYDLQAALYTRGVEAYLGRRLPFAFFFVEDSAPHGVWVYTAGQTLLSNGERKLRRAAAAFKRLQATGDWHSYMNASSVLELPHWAMLAPELDDEDR